MIRYQLNVGGTHFVISLTEEEMKRLKHDITTELTKIKKERIDNDLEKIKAQAVNLGVSCTVRNNFVHEFWMSLSPLYSGHDAMCCISTVDGTLTITDLDLNVPRSQVFAAEPKVKLFYEFLNFAMKFCNMKA